MSEEQFNKLISTIEEANQTSFCDHLVDALIAAMVAIIVSYSIGWFKQKNKERKNRNILRLIQEDMNKIVEKSRNILLSDERSDFEKKIEAGNTYNKLRNQIFKAKFIILENDPKNTLDLKNKLEEIEGELDETYNKLSEESGYKKVNELFHRVLGSYDGFLIDYGRINFPDKNKFK